ncbi:hypothetical protein Hanom_Chr17g01537051 [Helianthus anomalus]
MQRLISLTYNEKSCFTVLPSLFSVFDEISTYLLISTAFRSGPFVESGVFLKENEKTNDKLTFI